MEANINPISPISKINCNCSWKKKWLYGWHDTQTYQGKTSMPKPLAYIGMTSKYPENKVHGAYMGPTWGLQDPGGPHVGPMILAIWVQLEAITMLSNLPGGRFNMNMPSCQCENFHYKDKMVSWLSYLYNGISILSGLFNHKGKTRDTTQVMRNILKIFPYWSDSKSNWQCMGNYKKLIISLFR